MKSIRVCQLRPGDRFIMLTISYQVIDVRDGIVYYQVLSRNWRGTPILDGYSQEMGAGSQKFVNLISHEVDTRNKKVVRPDPEIVGPGPDKKDGSGQGKESAA